MSYEKALETGPSTGWAIRLGADHICGICIHASANWARCGGQLPISGSVGGLKLPSAQLLPVRWKPNPAWRRPLRCRESCRAPMEHPNAAGAWAGFVTCILSAVTDLTLQYQAANTDKLDPVLWPMRWGAF